MLLFVVTGMRVGSPFFYEAAMVIGILAGTYSSIYVAAPLTEWIDRRFRAQSPKKPRPSGPRRPWLLRLLCQP